MHDRGSTRALASLATIALACACSSDPPATPADAGPEDAGVDGAIPCEGTGVSKGPWVVGAQSTVAKIRFESCRAGIPGDITIEPEAGGTPLTVKSIETPTVVTVTYIAPLNTSATPDYAGTWYMHEAALTGLTEGTCYRYALAADATAKGRFCTAKKPGDDFRFLAIGDTNPGLGDTTSKLLEKLVPQAFDFTLHLGDIEYYDSTLETWAYWAPKMAPLLRQGAFFPAIGNHEFEKPTEYAEYVLRYFGAAGLNGSDGTYRFSNAGVHFFVLDTEEPTGPTSTQATWFASEIVKAEQEPGYRFSIVYFHKPLVTCGDTGDDPVARQFFEPLFIAHKVPLVLQAHMHGYERFDFGNITYVTSGGGGGRIDDVDKNITRAYCNKRVASGPIFHGTIIDVKTGKLEGKAIDQDGVERDTYSLTVP
ncbi:hypothetical protein BH09MYX1_BH09MYX1_25580 [soil metagenome]